jgi:hypothetical protein
MLKRRGVLVRQQVINQRGIAANGFRAFAV